MRNTSSPLRQRIQMFRERLEAREIVDRQEVVHKRQRRLHAARQRTVVGRSEQRIQPDQAMARATQAGHLGPKLVGLSAVPAVRDQQHDRTATGYAPSPVDIECPQRLADTSAASPIRELTQNSPHRVIRASARQAVRDPREGGRKQKRFDAVDAKLPTIRGQAVRKMQQDT